MIAIHLTSLIALTDAQSENRCKLKGILMAHFKPAARCAISLLIMGLNAAHSDAAPRPSQSNSVPRSQAHPVTIVFQAESEELHAQLMTSEAARAAPLLIMLHGLPGYQRNADVATAAYEAGWNVLTFDYPGNWNNPGIFSIGNAVSAARAALGAASSTKFAPPNNIAPTCVVLFGHSFGGWIAAKLMNDPVVKGIVLAEPWNVGAEAPRWRTASRNERKAMVAEFGEWGSSIRGATPRSVLAEIARHDDWDLNSLPPTSHPPTLLVGAARGNGEFVTSLHSEWPASRFIRLETDHELSGERQKLIGATLGFLKDVRGSEGCRTMGRADDVEKVSRKFDDAQFRKDLAAIDAMLAPDMVYITGRGRRVGRKEFLAAYADPTEKFAPFQIADRQLVNLEDNVVAVTGEGSISGTNASGAFSDHFRYTDIFRLDEAGWKVVFVQVTRISS